MLGRRVAARWFGEIATILSKNAVIDFLPIIEILLLRFVRRVARKCSQNSATPGSTFKDFHRLRPNSAPWVASSIHRMSTGAQQGQAADQPAQIR